MSVKHTGTLGVTARKPRINCDVCIVGAGLAGLAAASGLARRGYDVKVLEASPQVKRETGTSLSLGDNAWKSLLELQPEVVPLMKSRGVKRGSMRQHIKTSKDGPLVANDFPPMQDTFAIRWIEVQRSLAEFVPSELIETGYKATGFTEHDQDGIVAVHFQDKPDITARFVIAADGIRSRLRSTIVPNDPGPRYLGDMNWSAILMDPTPQVKSLVGPGALLAWQNYEIWDHAPMQMVVSDIGQGCFIWQVRISNEQPAFTQGSTGGLAVPGVRARLVTAMKEAGWEIPAAVIQDTPESAIFERASMGRIPLDELDGRMTSPGHRVVLVGDAAHAMHSSPGQGARTAFEDVHTIVNLLDTQRSQNNLHGWLLQDGETKNTASHIRQCLTDSMAPESHSADLPALQNGDRPALANIAHAYHDLRYARMCRLQRFANEGCGSGELRAAAAPQDIPQNEMLTRLKELHTWLSQYPYNPHGDPDSKYWKPLTTDTSKARQSMAHV